MLYLTGAITTISITGGFIWIDPKDFNLSKYNKNSSKG